MSKQGGMILVTVLIFLSIFAMLVLTSTQSSFLQQKMTQHILHTEQVYAALETTVLAVEKQVRTTLPSCTRFDAGRDYYYHKTADWWRQPWQCQQEVDHTVIRYLLEKIAEDPCAQFGNKSVTIMHWRITAVALLANQQLQLVQSEFAQISPEPRKCLTKQTHLVTIGRHAWREQF